MILVRWPRRAALVLFLWGLVAWVSTTYAKPVFPDCYPQAYWNGRNFVPTGEWRCLGPR